MPLMPPMRAVTIPTLLAHRSRPATLYRALQVFAAIAPQVPFALTVYVLRAHLATEANPVWIMPSTSPQGLALMGVVRVALTASVLYQTEYCWRLRDRVARAAGWITLIAWSLFVSVDAIHDISVLLTILLAR